MTDFYSQNRCVCSTRSHGPLLCAFCLSFHFKIRTICFQINDNANLTFSVLLFRVEIIKSNCKAKNDNC